MDIGKLGVWTFQLAAAPDEEIAAAGAELTDHGYGAVWFPGGAFPQARKLLENTAGLAVATGIANIWTHDPAMVAAEVPKIKGDHPDRFLLGIGVSHPEAINRQQPGRYTKPLQAMRTYLDDIDAGGARLSADAVLAALGPKMLELSATRTRGAHPYFVPVEHTAFAREHIGPDALLAPEQAVVLETDPAAARQLARSHMALYLRLSNYTNNLRRFGFGDDDFASGGSDRVVDAVVAWGDEQAIARRIRDHYDAGADHVCIQVIAADQRAVPRSEWRRIGAAVMG